MAGIRLVPEFPPTTARFFEDTVGTIGAGSCTLCHSHRAQSDPGVIELGTNAQPYREGMVVVCLTCARQIGALAGMIGEDKANVLQAERDDAVARADRLEQVERILPQLLTVGRHLVATAEAHIADDFGGDQ